jgi:hypothetical protein
MDRRDHTRLDWQQWAFEQCELRDTGTRQARRAVDSRVCAMNSGMEIVIWANSTQVNRRGSRIQEAATLKAA